MREFYLNGEIIEVTEELWQLMEHDRDRTRKAQAAYDWRVSSYDEWQDEPHDTNQKTDEETVAYNMLLEQLHDALAQLEEDELELIRALFERQMTEHEFGMAIKVSPKTIHSRKKAVLNKLAARLKN